MKHDRKFITVYENEDGVVETGRESPFEQITADTSDIMLGEMCAGEGRPLPLQHERPIHPSFHNGVYGYYERHLEAKPSLHQIIRKRKPKGDLMTEIILEMCTIRKKYDAANLPLILRKQFAKPTRMHK